MTNNIFIKEFSKKINMGETQIQEIIDALKDFILELVQKGHNVCIKKFGTFKLVQKKQRFCYNPQTRGKVFVSAKNVVVFKMSNQLL